LVRFDETGSTIADVAWALGAPVVIVASAGLGSLNSTALTAAALAHRGVESMGVVIGSWPERPNLAERSNLNDLPVAARGPLIGALPAGICAAERDDFSKAAYVGLSPWLGGQFDEDEFRDQFL
jgi:dethiobiotin synthetase